MEQVYLTLGCHGLNEEGFVSCPGIENDILIISNKIIEYNKLLDYLDAAGLFDKPALDINTIKHVLRNIYDNFDQLNKKIWSEKRHIILQKFLVNHKNCGLYLKLSLEARQTVIQEKEINVIIPKAGGSI